MFSLKTKSLFNLFLVIGLIFQFGFAQDSLFNGWKLIRTENGISVYSRISNTSKFQELRSVVQVKSTLSGVVALLNDFESYPNGSTVVTVPPQPEQSLSTNVFITRR